MNSKDLSVLAEAAAQDLRDKVGPDATVLVFLIQDREENAHYHLATRGRPFSIRGAAARMNTISDLTLSAPMRPNTISDLTLDRGV